jgi:hypothetical protein
MVAPPHTLSGLCLTLAGRNSWRLKHSLRHPALSTGGRLMGALVGLKWGVVGDDVGSVGAMVGELVTGVSYSYSLMVSFSQHLAHRVTLMTAACEFATSKSRARRRRRSDRMGQIPMSPTAPRTSIRVVFGFIGLVALTGNVGLSLYHMRWNATHENVEANLIGKPLYIVTALMMIHWVFRMLTFLTSFTKLSEDEPYKKIVDNNRLFGVSVLWFQAEFLVFMLALAEGWISGEIIGMFPTTLIALMLLCNVVAIFTTLLSYYTI